MGEVWHRFVAFRVEPLTTIFLLIFLTFPSELFRLTHSCLCISQIRKFILILSIFSLLSYKMNQLTIKYFEDAFLFNSHGALLKGLFLNLNITKNTINVIQSLLIILNRIISTIIYEKRRYTRKKTQNAFSFYLRDIFA